ncbi:unnamed protein product, partial [Discosporangium mesarthrocarpum]
MRGGQGGRAHNGLIVEVKKGEEGGKIIAHKGPAATDKVPKNHCPSPNPNADPNPSPSPDMHALVVVLAQRFLPALAGIALGTPQWGLRAGVGAGAGAGTGHLGGSGSGTGALGRPGEGLFGSRAAKLLLPRVRSGSGSGSGIGLGLRYSSGDVPPPAPTMLTGFATECAFLILRLACLVAT